MNATVFGKPCWAFMHGIAPHVHESEKLSRAFAALVASYSKSLPCSACQGSIGGFVQEAQVKTRKDVFEHAKSGSAPQWCRMVHGFVERKLARQRWQQSVTPFLASALVETPATASADEAKKVKRSVMTLVDSFGEAQGAEMTLKTPSEEVERMRHAAECFFRGGKPFDIQDVWLFVLITCYFHEYKACDAEDGAVAVPVPLDLHKMLWALADLVEPWFSSDADSLRVLALCAKAFAAATGSASALAPALAPLAPALAAPTQIAAPQVQKKHSSAPLSAEEQEFKRVVHASIARAALRRPHRSFLSPLDDDFDKQEGSSESSSCSSEEETDEEGVLEQNLSCAVKETKHAPQCAAKGLFAAAALARLHVLPSALFQAHKSETEALNALNHLVEKREADVEAARAVIAPMRAKVCSVTTCQ